MSEYLIPVTVVGGLLALVIAGAGLLWVGTVRIAGLKRVAARDCIYASLALLGAGLAAAYTVVCSLAMGLASRPPPWAWPLATGFLWLPAAWLIIKVRFRTTLDRAALASLPVAALYALVGALVTWLSR